MPKSDQWPMLRDPGYSDRWRPSQPVIEPCFVEYHRNAMRWHHLLSTVSLTQGLYSDLILYIVPPSPKNHSHRKQRVFVFYFICSYLFPLFVLVPIQFQHFHVFLGRWDYLGTPQGNRVALLPVTSQSSLLFHVLCLLQATFATQF